MGKPNSQFEQLAQDAAERIEDARAAGQQLTFLPDEPTPAEVAGRRGRGKGKVTSILRDWCAAKGYRMPEDVLIEMAGMASSEDVFLTAMARTEQVLAWAQDGAVGYKGAPVAPSMAQRLDAFKFVFTAQLRAAEALLPYGLGKVTPDAPAGTVVNVAVMPSQPAQGAGSGPDRARDVTPQPRGIAPPPMPGQTVENQALSEVPRDGSDR